MRMFLRPDQVVRYRCQGMLFPVPVLAEAEVAAYRSSLEELARLQGSALKRFDQAHLFFPWAYRLATHDAVLDAVASVLGDDLLIDGTLILCKYPHDPSYVSWHQDSVYSNWHLSPSTTAWVALTESTARNGCMRAIAGSQEWGLLKHREARDPDNMLRRGEQVGVAVNEAMAVDIELRPGEMSLHHCNLLHSSGPNRSDEKRIGFIVRFVTDRVQGRAGPLVRARGTAGCGRLNLVGAPSESDPELAIAAWREYTGRRGQS
jgi:non-haem Fe2+, alpha-ketoglutarate-dependent halogenase